MRFLVSAQYVEVGALLPPEAIGPLSQQVILPSLEMLAKWEQDGKIRGGVNAGARAGAFILDAASNEEVGTLLASLPFWGLVKWDVTPLQSFASTIERDRAAFERAAARAPKR
jgi:hypothetical protein